MKSRFMVVVIAFLVLWLVVPPNLMAPSIAHAQAAVPQNTHLNRVPIPVTESILKQINLRGTGSGTNQQTTPESGIALTKNNQKSKRDLHLRDDAPLTPGLYAECPKGAVHCELSFFAYVKPTGVTDDGKDLIFPNTVTFPVTENVYTALAYLECTKAGGVGRPLKVLMNKNNTVTVSTDGPTLGNDICVYLLPQPSPDETQIFGVTVEKMKKDPYLYNWYEELTGK